MKDLCECCEQERFHCPALQVNCIMPGGITVNDREHICYAIKQYTKEQYEIPKLVKKYIQPDHIKHLENLN
jgi:hypothetical protein